MLVMMHEYKEDLGVKGDIHLGTKTQGRDVLVILLSLDMSPAVKNHVAT